MQEEKISKKQEKQDSDLFQQKLSSECQKVYFLLLHLAGEYFFLFPLRGPQQTHNSAHNSQLPVKAMNKIHRLPFLRIIAAFHICSASYICQCCLWQFVAPPRALAMDRNVFGCRHNAWLNSAGHTRSTCDYCTPPRSYFSVTIHSCSTQGHRQPSEQAQNKKQKYMCVSCIGPIAMGPLAYLHQLMCIALPLPFLLHIH